MARVFRDLNSEPLDPARVGVDDLELHPGRVRDHLAARGHVPSKQKDKAAQGVHFVQPFGNKVMLYPKGPVRMDGELRDIITQDGWRISAHFQLSARLVEEMVVSEAGGDWRDATRDAAHRVLRTELENNESADLRPRPQALDAGVAEEVNLLSRRWGVEVDWFRVTIRWAYAVPPAHIVAHPDAPGGSMHGPS